MRGTFCKVLIAGVAGASACAQPQQPAPVAAQRFAVPAAESTRPPPPQGYSQEARRIADCLATYPGYDHRTDRIEVRPGVTRRCPL